MIEGRTVLERTSSRAGLPFEQVTSICESFTQDWDLARRPDIPTYLDRVGASTRPNLLRNLLEHDIRRRRQAGETPTAEEYIARFPGQATLVREVFLLSTASHLSLSLELSEPESGISASLPAALLGDYRLIRELGRGGMGVVFEAIHVHRGERVALKLLPEVDGARLYRFKREFRSAANLSHPNLIGLHSLESDGDQWFFTMDLLSGTDFLGYVRPGGRLDEPRLRAALTQLAMGVMALHRNHIIHRDLKPSNVLVTAEGRVVLLDFGLVVELELPGLVQSLEQIAGTPGYMAPEQASGVPVTPACDWYAVGTVLYEALCGKRPFDGPILQVLIDKRSLDPTPLPKDPSIPPDLAALCIRLIAREPEDRPGPLEITAAIAANLEASESGTAGPPGRVLVGRAAQLGALANAYRAMELIEEPQIVFVLGRSGEGKSSLVEHFLGPMRAEGRAAVMSGRCYDRESVPFKALDSLIDALASHLRSLPETDAALLLPDDIGVLSVVFPVLQRVEVVAKAASVRKATIDEQQVRQRAFAALRSLLVRLGRRSPVVWCIDDLQWGDADSAEALFQIFKPPEAPRLLFIGTYRSDEAETSSFLNAWRELQRRNEVRLEENEVKVGPLTTEECADLVVLLFGRDDERIRRRAEEFARETRGNPFLLIELIGCFDPVTDSFEHVPLHEVVGRKLVRLPGEAGPLLEAVAVSGQALAVEEATRTVGHDSSPMATITRMRNERLVRIVGTDDRPMIDTYHDRVRETVLGGLDEGRRREIHRSLADVIEAGVGSSADELEVGLSRWDGGGGTGDLPVSRVYDLAYHFDAAGDARRGWIYGLVAGEQARRQSALEVAAHNFAIARRNAEATEAPSAVRYRISEGQGWTLTLLGRYEDATESLVGTVDLAADAERKARIEALQGEIVFKQGSLDRSIAVYEEGLRRVGHSVPRSRVGLAFGLLRESVIQGLHSLRRGRLHSEPASTRLDLAVRLLYRLATVYAFQATPKAMWYQLYGMNLSETVPPSQHLAMTYAYHSCIMSMLGWQSRGRRHGERSLAMAHECDDFWVLGSCYNYTGIGHYAAARYEEGVTELATAIHHFEKAGDPWELNLARFHKGCCHFGLGDLAAALEEARRTFAASARLGDSRTLCSSYLWARATRGNLPFEELKGCFPCRPDDVMSTVHGLMAEGHWHSFHERTAEALDRFERSATLVLATWCVNSHMIMVMPELATALRAHALAIRRADPRESERLARRALVQARRAAWITRFFPAAYPVALRELSIQLADRGRIREAIRAADRSCALAEGQKARYEHARSLRVRGEIGKRFGLQGAAEQIRAAEQAIEAIEGALAASMRDCPMGP